MFLTLKKNLDLKIQQLDSLSKRQLDSEVILGFSKLCFTFTTYRISSTSIFIPYHLSSTSYPPSSDQRHQHGQWGDAGRASEAVGHMGKPICEKSRVGSQVQRHRI